MMTAWLSELYERFWRHIEKRLLSRLEHNLTDSVVTEKSLMVKACMRIDSKLNDFHVRLVEMNQRLAQALSGLAASADALDNGIRELPAHIPFSWREYHAVNYAVEKLEHDPQFCASTTEDQQIKEAIRWAWRYCEHRRWNIISAERLGTLIRTRRDLGRLENVVPCVAPANMLERKQA